MYDVVKACILDFEPRLVFERDLQNAFEYDANKATMADACHCLAAMASDDFLKKRTGASLDVENALTATFNFVVRSK